MRPKLEKSLLCPACGVILAQAVLPRWPRSLLETLQVTTPEGQGVQPMGVGVQLRIARQEVAEAASPHERERAQARLGYLKRNVSELAFDLRCRNGHRVIRTMPQLVSAMRHASGSWVHLL